MMHPQPQPEPEPEPEPMVRHISDTARWVAAFRAQETARADALFRDPLAARLAGERGAEIARRLGQHPWAFVARTLLLDRILERCVAGGVDRVINLAAGLDTRPYRLPLPRELSWIEVDLPEILAEKEALLAGESPRCRLERVKLDLADATARRALFARLGAGVEKALILTEGLLIYLTEEQVASLAQDLSAISEFRLWLMDLVSPGLLKVLLRNYAGELSRAGVTMHFAPAAGPLFFAPLGWRPVEVHSILKEAARVGRLNPLLRLAALLPESRGRQGARPWGGICLLERTTR